MPRKKEPSFEEALARLEQIVGEMEQGELNLQDLVLRYSEGVTLANQCTQSLSRAEKAMDLLLQDKDGEAMTTPLEIEKEQGK
ncbi:exodeoxyribonuclease VII small subunit [Selenomonas bovis]|jgi:exodeoxyribonuclease VII small subunit|uniref:Exodeoxyribonuclease 7 small subunit n=1 Tax=Selenomonas bovis TaxID=416586 RepID=A0A848BBI7_9FIRM|nr:exodeoxyribonuclease VII small subunit [Selenomonas bovis]DAJ48656.1 MAG TPA: exodeoxyribonuclease VII small subunit [Caudoviricetes sp.]MCI6171985.1 exodeoxyribonuclease VII small subunit [Selenomonas bovis]MCI6752947.1 exodeoxyribonuclease VII small subunit [Selenomonas bovis]MCI7056229.1 exodeoxyribonuclease VII small subunit [Selenomonas bovis]NMD98647.1 exodeoxyribonuclease VII small subunit [Selenomonas bovis]